MNCNFKTMIKVAAGLGLILAAAYFALPAAQAWVLASAPVLLALVCPISMLLMMFMMKGKSNAGDCNDERKQAGAAPVDAPPRGAATDKAQRLPG